jgi:hypothetical protein
LLPWLVALLPCPHQLQQQQQHIFCWLMTAWALLLHLAAAFLQQQL